MRRSFLLATFTRPRSVLINDAHVEATDPTDVRLVAAAASIHVRDINQGRWRSWWQ